MGCNCGKSAAAMQYTYIAPNGTKTVYKTEIEAKAAQIRNGGGSISQSPR